MEHAIGISKVNIALPFPSSMLQNNCFMLSAVRHEIMMQLESLLLEARVCTSSNSYASFKLPELADAHKGKKQSTVWTIDHDAIYSTCKTPGSVQGLYVASASALVE